MDIHLPKELLSAQQDGSLVIFAGAGVSMSAPSSLPDFEGLVSKVARGTKFEGKPLTPFDKVLGDMERADIKVRRLSKQILGDPNSKPTKLHNLIFDIAGKNKDHIRIVSTNLDYHFSSVMKERGLELEEYFAPALPLGNDFNGIVHLHGSVLRSEARFVLTDGDFGKAYLIDGWASRFAKEMFLKYTVLFVGYSHGDIVMNYIARGMPPTGPGKRFALSHNENDVRWDDLGITLIEYPLKEIPDAHIALTEGLEEWSRRIAMGVLDHEKQIQRLVSQRPPIDQKDIDYLLDRIHDKDTRQFFLKYAQTPEWIVWADDQGLLKDLFDPTVTLDAMTRQLAFWLAGNFVRQHPFHLLSLIESKKGIIHPELWTRIAFGLHRKSDVAMDRRAFGIFIGLLLRKTYDSQGRDVLEYILEDCKYPEDCNAALALFVHLTKPFVELEKKIYVEEEHKDNPEKTLGANLAINGETHWLTRNWERIFRSNLSQFGERLFFVFKEHVESGYDLIRLFETDPEKFDSISYRRSAVERHRQNHSLANDFPNLLDCFSDVLEWAARERKDLTQVSLLWITAPKMLFRRIALFVMLKSEFHSADEKCQWLVDQELIYGYHTHHEVFGLLKEIYPAVSAENRKRLIAQIIKGPQNQEDQEDRKEWQQYPVFRVLAWLQSADAKCELAKTEIGKIKADHPNYMLSEHADFHGYLGEAVWVGSETPHSPEDLITMNLDANFQTLLTWSSESKFGIERGRSGLIDAVEKAVEKDLAFSFRLSDQLEKNQNWESDLWDGLLRGWVKATLTGDDIQKILKLVLDHQDLYKHFTYSLSDFLLALVSKKDPRLPESCYDEAMTVAENLWQVGKEVLKDREDVNDWLTAAINHHGGRLAEFWLHLLSQHNANAGKAQFPDRIRLNLELFLRDDSYQGKLARVVIASQTHFLFVSSPEWTVIHVVSLLDVDKDEGESQRAWDGYLSWGKWSDELLLHIRPLFQKLFKKIAVLGDEEDRFVEYVAGICLYASVHPQDGNWLNDFLSQATQRTRELFSRKLQWLFRNMKSEGRSLVWKKWIKDYWVNRDDGRPMRFDNAEKVDMIELGVFLDENLDEAVDLIVSSAAPTLDGSVIYHTLNSDGVGEKHPEATIKLLLHLLPAMGDQVWVCHDLEPLARILVDKLGSNPTHRANLSTLCDLLGQRHCSKAGEIRDSIPRGI